MVLGVQCVLIMVGIQWLLASYVSNLDSQNMVLHFAVDNNKFHDSLHDLGSVALLLYIRLIDFRASLGTVRCTGNERRLIDCSHYYTSHPNYCFRAGAVQCQKSIYCNVM